jgi:DNA-binding transcriptional ArsR family regulator
MLNKTELLLHPIRMRILLALARQNLTPLQLAQELVNVPQATLYRHLHKLVKAEILKVVEEHPVRGTVEKVYGINHETMRLGQQDLLRASKEELLELFTNFVLGQVREFAAYLQRDRVNLIEDKVTFRQAPFYLTDAEFMELVTEVGQAFMKHLPNKPAPGRKALMWSTIIMPKSEGNPESNLTGEGDPDPESK